MKETPPPATAHNPLAYKNEEFMAAHDAPPLRILAEKIIGAAIGFGLWCVLIALLTEIVWGIFAGGDSIQRGEMLIDHAGNDPEGLRFLLSGRRWLTLRAWRRAPGSGG